MKIHDVAARAARMEPAEYVLGAEDTGSHACYLIYGRLAPGEGGRLVKPGRGHEEIILAVKGRLEVSGSLTATLWEGNAFHIAGDQECRLSNPGDGEAVYVIAGGHAGGGHH